MYNSHGSMSIVYLAAFCVVAFLVVRGKNFTFPLLFDTPMPQFVKDSCDALGADVLPGPVGSVLSCGYSHATVCSRAGSRFQISRLCDSLHPSARNSNTRFQIFKFIFSMTLMVLEIFLAALLNLAERSVHDMSSDGARYFDITLRILCAFGYR